MSWIHNTPKESPHGAFVESRHGVRDASTRKTKDVLIWLRNVDSRFSRYNFEVVKILKSTYENLGCEVHSSNDWTEDIRDYQLVYWPVPVANSVWLDDILQKKWSGRVHVMHENCWEEPRKYINNELKPHTGMRVTDHICAEQRTQVETRSHPLTKDQRSLWIEITSQVRGGIVLSRVECPDSEGPWLATTTRDRISWVFSGDIHHVVVSQNAEANSRFLKNLYTVPVSTGDTGGDPGEFVPSGMCG